MTNELQTLTPEQRQKRVATALKWVGGIGAAALLSPVLFLALKGIGFAIAIGGAVGGTALALRFVPLVSMKVSNMVVRGVISEAKRNPIETLTNLQIEKQQQLEAQDQNIIIFATAVGNFDDKVRLYAKRYPDKAARYKEIASKMHEALDEQKELQDGARKALVALELRIQEARDMYDMALAAKQVTELSGSAQQRVFADIKQQIAFDSVTGSVNQSFAALDVAVARSKQLTAAPEEDSKMINIGKVEVVR